MTTRHSGLGSFSCADHCAPARRTRWLAAAALAFARLRSPCGVCTWGRGTPAEVRRPNAPIRSTSEQGGLREHVKPAEVTPARRAPGASSGAPVWHTAAVPQRRTAGVANNLRVSASAPEFHLGGAKTCVDGQPHRRCVDRPRAPGTCRAHQYRRPHVMIPMPTVILVCGLAVTLHCASLNRALCSWVASHHQTRRSWTTCVHVRGGLTVSSSPAAGGR